MFINDSLKISIYEKMWRDFKIGLNNTESIISALKEEGEVEMEVKGPADIQPFFDRVLKDYLFPKNMSRAKVYPPEFLQENEIELEKVGRIEDEWSYNVYFDRKNQIYWQDNMVVNTPMGFKISPYRNPVKRFKLKNS